jgi:hypothetical protein
MGRKLVWSLNPLLYRQGLLKALMRAQAPEFELQMWTEEPNGKKSRLWSRLELSQWMVLKLLPASCWKKGCLQLGYCSAWKLEADVAHLQESPDLLLASMPALSVVQSQTPKMAQAQQLDLLAEPEPEPCLPVSLEPALPLEPALLLAPAPLLPPVAIELLLSLLVVVVQRTCRL